MYTATPQAHARPTPRRGALEGEVDGLGEDAVEEVGVAGMLEYILALWSRMDDIELLSRCLVDGRFE